MTTITKKEFIEMLGNGNVIGFEKDISHTVGEYLDANLDDNITFEEHNYRIGEGFDNLIEFTEFKDILITTEMKEIGSDESKAMKYYEYKVLKKDDYIAIIAAVVIVVTTPDIEPYYEVEAKLYVFRNV